MYGEYGDFNFGDQGMALASVNRLKRYFPDINIVATGSWFKTSVLFPFARIMLPFPRPQPQQLHLRRLQRVLKRLGIQVLNLERHYEASFQKDCASNGPARKVIDEMKRSDFVFDIGHGGINDVFECILPYFYWLSHKLDKPLFISGKSIGPLSNPEVTRAFRMGLNYAHTIVLRDAEISRQILVDQIGINDSIKIVEAGDDTLDLEPVEPDWSILPFELKQTIVSGDFFAVQWRPVDYTNSFGLETYENLASLIIRLSERFHLMPIFVPMSWEARPDIQSATILEALLPRRIHYTIVSRNIGARATKWILGQAKFGLGLSYHFHVWLLSQGHPSIGIYTNPYYQIKITGAFRAYGYKGQPASLSDVLQSSELPSIEIIEKWNKDDSTRLINNAAQLCRKWHIAFTNFLRDNGLAANPQSQFGLVDTKK